MTISTFNSSVNSAKVELSCDSPVPCINPIPTSRTISPIGAAAIYRRCVMVSAEAAEKNLREKRLSAERIAYLQARREKEKAKLKLEQVTTQAPSAESEVQNLGAWR